MSSLVKYTRIKGLEDLVIKLGLYPNDANVVVEIIKSKNAYIQELRRQLKLPKKKHP